MSLWLRSAKLRRAFALSAVVLATGGLVLYKAPSSAAFPSDPPPVGVLRADGKSSVAFSGPGAHGVLSLSHTKVLAGQTTPVYAELRLVADSSESTPIRAPNGSPPEHERRGPKTPPASSSRRTSVSRGCG